jgi:prepilin-type N-terminal cleavage/methylation domain-containing protein
MFPADVQPFWLANSFFCSTAMYLSRRTGYTLIEVIMVLIVLTIAAAVVAPSLLSPAPRSSLKEVVGSARDAAVRRGEMVRLRVDRVGLWQATVETGGQTELLISGRVLDATGTTMDLLFSPLGTCAPPPESIPAQSLAAFDPLTCQPRSK